VGLKGDIYAWYTRLWIGSYEPLQSPKREIFADGLKTCPECAERVQGPALVCRYCGYRFDGVPQPVAMGEASTSGVAIAAFICSLIGLWIAAIPLGIHAQRQIDASGGHKTGRGFATAGVVLGALGLIATCALVISAVKAAQSQAATDPRGAPLRAYAVGGTPLGAPVEGPDGTVWFLSTAMRPNGTIFVGAVGRLDPKTGSVAYAPLKDYPNGDVRGLVAWHGMMWSTQSVEATLLGTPSMTALLQIDPRTLAIKRIPTRLPYAIELTVGPDGRFWGETGVRLLGSHQPMHIMQVSSTGDTRAFAIKKFSNEARLLAGPDGRLWFTDDDRNALGAMSATGRTELYPLGAHARDPRGAVIAGHSHALLFLVDGGVGEMTTQGRFVRYYRTCVSAETDLALGSDGNVWVTTEAGELLRVSPTGTTAVRRAPLAETEEVRSGPESKLWLTSFSPAFSSEIVSFAPRALSGRRLERPRCG
jgi:virginiamycin B lyase